MTLHLALLIAYCVVIMGMGLFVGRQTKTKGDFFVAGRSLGPGLLFATLVAANIGAGSTVGASGLGYRDGLSAWWWVGSAALGSLVQAFLVGPKMRRIAADRGLHTVGDFLEYRYGRNVRGIVSSLLWVGTLAILAGQIIAMGLVLNAVLGLPKYVGCLLGGIVMTVYFTAGGLLTSAWVNALQLVLELSVYALLVPVALSRAGGWAGLAAAAPPNPEYWSFWQGGASGIAYLALLAPAFVISPGLLRRSTARVTTVPSASASPPTRRCCSCSPSCPSPWAWSRACCTPIWPTTSWPCPRCSCATCRPSWARSGWPPCSRRR